MLTVSGRKGPSRFVVNVGILLVFAASALLLVPADATTVSKGLARESARPNVVVVMTDDMRADDLLFMPRTRRLLGGGGLRFENSFSPDPLCCPARASFLSGQYSHNHGVLSHERPWGFRAFDDAVTFPTALKRSGYRTAYVGKYLNGYGTQRSRVTGGPSLRYVPNGWTDWYAAVEPPPGTYSGGTYNYMNTVYNHNGRIDAGHRGEYQTVGITSISNRLIRKYAAGSAPFFLYAGYVAPHFGSPHESDDRSFGLSREDVREFRTPARPGWVRGRFNDLVRRAPGLPRGGGAAEADMSDKPSWMRIRDEWSAAKRRAGRQLARQRAEALYVLDVQVARMVSVLKREGEWSNTVMMFTSDNGYYLGEHRLLPGKVKGHEPSIRVPMLVTGPGMRFGERRYTPITTIDLTATILDLAHATSRLTARHPIDGISRLGVMRGPDLGWTTPVVTEGHFWRRYDAAKAEQLGFRDPSLSYIGVRTARYAYLRYISGGEELYDLATDANQLTSLARDRAHVELRARLREAWTTYKDCRGAECRAPLPPDLSTDAGRTRSLGRSFWEQVDRRQAY